jgi:hypothetical protein
LSIGLSISIIAASGILKTTYLEVHAWFPFISEFWLPFVIGLLFLPFFCAFVWMLSVIPAPSQKDMQLRSARPPMTNADKAAVLRDYGVWLICIIVVYCMLSTMRDFRDNFSVEIWNEIDAHWYKAILAQTEVISTVFVLLAVGSLSLIKNNSRAFWVTMLVILAGILISGGSTLLFQWKMISGFSWMLLLGTGLFLAYVPVQVALFERMIAMFHIKANAGFFVYICDATGYLGSVAILLYKEFFAKSTSWAALLMQFSYMLALTGGILLLLAALSLKRRVRPEKPEALTEAVM